jgi:protein-S-isoprenylcysteine O-methyltransferase Ste14
MFDKSPGEFLLLGSFVLAFTHFLYGGARTFKWGDGDELAGGIAQLAFLGGPLAAFALAFRTRIGLVNGLAALVLLLASLSLYEWARKTVKDRGFHIAWSGDVPDSLCADGPYRVVRHPFYLSYMLAFVALLVAIPTLPTLGVAVLGGAVFAHAAFSDERSIAASPLGDEYARYKLSTGMLVPRLGRSKGTS